MNDETFAALWRLEVPKVVAQHQRDLEEIRRMRMSGSIDAVYMGALHQRLGEIMDLNVRVLTLENQIKSLEVECDKWKSQAEYEKQCRIYEAKQREIQ